MVVLHNQSLKDLQLEHINLAGLAKDDHHHTSLLMTKDEVHPISNQDKLFLFLVRMQDEVHRFAITFHRNKRSKKLVTSFYDDIEGVGLKRRAILDKTYPTLDALKSASIKELSQIVPLDVAERIIEKLNKQNTK